jgi:DNA-binding MarR family transcriptional regulator
MGGREPKQSDGEVLELLIQSPDPAHFTTEVAELLDMTQQGAYSRLSKLESKGYVRGKTEKNARVWWVTTAGRDYVAGC